MHIIKREKKIQKVRREHLVDLHKNSNWRMKGHSHSRTPRSQTLDISALPEVKKKTRTLHRYLSIDSTKSTVASHAELVQVNLLASACMNQLPFTVVVTRSLLRHHIPLATIMKRRASIVLPGYFSVGASRNSG